MPIDTLRTPAEVTEEAGRKFEAWKTIRYDAEYCGDTLKTECAYIARGAELLHTLAVTHFSRKKPGFWARFFRTRNAREYAGERRLMETMAKELRRIDPYGNFGGFTATDKIIYEDFTKRDKMLPKMNVMIFDPYGELKEAEMTEEERVGCFWDLDRAFTEIEMEYDKSREEERDAEEKTETVDDFEEPEMTEEEEPQEYEEADKEPGQEKTEELKEAEPIL